jgi:hypothetical protein
MTIRKLFGIGLVLVIQITQVDALLKLIGAGLVPATVASDAVHIATASVHRVDFLVTWNFKHTVNPLIRQRLRQEVALIGYVVPVLCTPEELLNDEDD